MSSRRRASMLAEHAQIRSLIDELGPRASRARLATLVRAIEEHCTGEESRAKAGGAAEREERWLLVTIARRLLEDPHDRETRTVRLRNLRSAFVEHCMRTELR